MVNLLENINEMGTLLLLVTTIVYDRILRRKKRNRELSTFERVMYTLTSTALCLYLISYVLLYFGL